MQLSAWWDLQGLIYGELLDSKVRINAPFYTELLAEAVRQKRPDNTKIILQHDNAKPHTAKLTKIQELDWEVLPHPPYSSDLAPLDYHLFRDLQVTLEDVHFNDEVKTWLTNYFDSNPRIFDIIRSLLSRWAKVQEEGPNVVYK
uniref:Transposase n=1 Tax=Acrobeloides nanus TaxID=290746 RepID=A0A914CMV7_9BILA